jgi:hypothetical protein
MNDNHIKNLLINILQRHQGRQNAILRRDLRQVLELTLSQDRKLRLLIAELRNDGMPILFATDNPAGYYLPDNLKELKEGMDKLRSYIIDECITLRNLKVKGSQYIQGEYQKQLL